MSWPPWQLQVRLQKLLKARFGQSSEKVSGIQLSLFLELMGVALSLRWIRCRFCNEADDPLEMLRKIVGEYSCYFWIAKWAAAVGASQLEIIVIDIEYQRALGLPVKCYKAEEIAFAMAVLKGHEACPKSGLIP